MSMDKAIASGKEKRKPYRGAPSVDYTCRNGGSCPWCQSNRLHKYKKQEPLILSDMEVNNESESEV